MIYLVEFECINHKVVSDTAMKLFIGFYGKCDVSVLNVNSKPMIHNIYSDILLDT